MDMHMSYFKNMDDILDSSKDKIKLLNMNYKITMLNLDIF